MPNDFESCYRAVHSRDARFDGRFVTCVTSTGIYCRPSCPALTPKRANVQFLPNAAAAQRAGFRACLRCRPDTAPGDPQWNYRSDVAGRAMRMISDGVVDREGVPGLASKIGYTTRHLTRLLNAEVGAGPLALARAQRAQTARVLIETTDMGLADVAFAAGFGSVRQFNDTINETYGRSPTQLRAAKTPPVRTALGVIDLRLPYREPMSLTSIFDFLRARTVAGVEEHVEGRLRRGLTLPHGPAVVELGPGDGFVQASLQLSDMRDLAPAVARCRRLLDLDADPVAVDSALAEDPALRASIAKDPGLRVPGAVDGFEIAVRGVVGQQISVSGARTVLARLISTVRTGHSDSPENAARTGHSDSPENAARTGHSEIAGFPQAEEIAEAPDAAFGMPATRRATIRALAGAVASGRISLDPGADREETRARLLELPGIGPWTADYVAMRALGDPDILMDTDLGVRRGAAALGINDVKRHGQQHWAPWRSYATVRLWRAGT